MKPHPLDDETPKMADISNRRDRPFGRALERRQWSRWDGVSSGNPDARPESDAEALEGEIDRIASTFAMAGETRDDKGRWLVGGRSHPDRDVKLYLTRVTFTLTVKEIGAIFGLNRRASIMASIKRGRLLVEARYRAKNEPIW